VIPIGRSLTNQFFWWLLAGHQAILCGCGARGMEV